MIKTLSKYIGKYKTASIMTIVLTTAEVVLDIILPICMARMIDIGILNGEMSAVFKYSGIMAALSIFAFITGVASGRLAAKASTGFVANLRKGMFRKVQEYSFKNIDDFSTAGLITRITTDASNMQMAYQMLISVCVRSSLSILLALIMSIIISPNLSKRLVVATVFLGIVLFTIIHFARLYFKRVFNEYDNFNASLQENIRGIRVVKSFVRENFEIHKFNKAIERLYKLFCKAETLTCINGPFMLLIGYGCILALSWFGAHEVIDGCLSTGQLTGLLTYVVNIMLSLMMLSMAFVTITLSTASAERICQIFDEVPDIRNPENPVFEVKDGSIDFDNVSFAYNTDANKYALSDIDIHIKSGETIGIIGPTGSAKSSIVSLIPRLYDATKGTVKVGGFDVKEYDVKTLRDNVSMVLQNNVLFSGSILDNLRWGNPHASEEECVHACKLACADEFIERKTEKYNTRIERGGNNVSGGQKQRLCIARALLKNPKILILDDSTSAVDTVTETKIQKAIEEYIPDTTKIIIAQRISSVQNADRIIVMENGMINGIGTHDELMKNNEIYRSIVEVQQAANADFDSKEV